jgi:hypothetical protein
MPLYLATVSNAEDIVDVCGGHSWNHRAIIPDCIRQPSIMDMVFICDSLRWSNIYETLFSMPWNLVFFFSTRLSLVNYGYVDYLRNAIKTLFSVTHNKDMRAI